MFLIFIFVIKIVVVICKPSDIEEIEGDYMFVARLENSDENLLNKVVHSADETYALYNFHYKMVKLVAISIFITINKSPDQAYKGRLSLY